MTYLTQNHLKYGLATTAITAACLLIMYLQHQSFEEKSPIEMTVMALMPLALLYLGIKAYKKIRKNKLSFKDGLVEGFKISLVHALVSPFVFLFFYLYVNPSLLDYAKMAYGMQSQTNEMVIAVDMVAQVVASIIFGLIYSAIATLFLRTRTSK